MYVFRFFVPQHEQLKTVTYIFLDHAHFNRLPNRHQRSYVAVLLIAIAICVVEISAIEPPVFPPAFTATNVIYETTRPASLSIISYIYDYNRTLEKLIFFGTCALDISFVCSSH